MLSPATDIGREVGCSVSAKVQEEQMHDVNRREENFAGGRKRSLINQDWRDANNGIDSK